MIMTIKTMSIDEIALVGGGMRLAPAHGIWVQDQSLAGYEMEYGLFEGAAYYYYDRVRRNLGYTDGFHTPPAHYLP